MNTIYIFYGLLSKSGKCLSEAESKELSPQIKSILKKHRCVDVKLKYNQMDEAIWICLKRDIHLKNDFSQVQDVACLLEKITEKFISISVYDINNKLSVHFWDDIMDYTVEDLEILSISDLLFVDNESGVNHRGKITKVHIKSTKTYSINKYEFIGKFVADNGIDLSKSDKIIIDNYIEDQVSKIQYGWSAYDAINFIASIHFFDEKYTPTVSSLPNWFRNIVFNPNPFYDLVFNLNLFKIENEKLLFDIDFSFNIKADKKYQSWINLVLNTYQFFKDPEFNKLATNGIRTEFNFLSLEFMDKKMYDHRGYTKFWLHLDPITTNSPDTIIVTYE